MNLSLSLSLSLYRGTPVSFLLRQVVNVVHSRILSQTSRVATTYEKSSLARRGKTERYIRGRDSTNRINVTARDQTKDRPAVCTNATVKKQLM